jgi:ABC-2 type transport system permease protein
MHPVIRALSLLSPMRYYLEFGYGILLKGVGFSYLWKDVLGMIGVGGILFVITSLKFRQSFAK